MNVGGQLPPLLHDRRVCDPALIGLVATGAHDGALHGIAFVPRDLQRFYLVQEARPLAHELVATAARIAPRLDLLHGVHQLLAHARKTVVHHLLAGDDAAEVAFLETIADERLDGNAGTVESAPWCQM